jgi:hypothetical protein
VFRQEEEIMRQRKKSGMDRKHGAKALGVLGHDPSLAKAMNTLGMDSDELHNHQQEQISQYEDTMKRYHSSSECSKLCRKRDTSVLNKKTTTKAQALTSVNDVVFLLHCRKY